MIIMFENMLRDEYFMISPRKVEEGIIKMARIAAGIANGVQISAEDDPVIERLPVWV